MGKICFGKHYNRAQYFATVFLLVGICLFSLSDISLDAESTNLHILGLLFRLLDCNLQVFSVCVFLYWWSQLDNTSKRRWYCNSIALREVVRNILLCTKHQVFFNSIYGVGIISVLLVITGEFGPAFEFCLDKPHIYYKIAVLIEVLSSLISSYPYLGILVQCFCCQ